MAYKFQFGQAILSGNLDQEGDIVVKDIAGNTQAKVEDNGVISGSSNFSAGGTVSLLGVAQAAVDVANDSLFYFDATDGLMKRETVGAFAADIAGDGLAASSNQLAVQVDDSTIETDSDALRVKDAGITEAKIATSVAGDGLTGGGGSALAVGAGSLIDVQANQVDVDLTEAAAATIAHADQLIFLDGGATGAASKGSTADLAALLDGSGLSRSNSTLSVAVSGAVHIASDKVSITGSITGDALDFAGGADSISAIHVVADETTIESAGRSSLRVKDGGIDADALAASVAGNGLTGGGGSALAVGAGSLIDVQADQVDVDLTEAAAATIANGDHLIFLDGGATGAASKGSTADLAALLDGSGLSRSNSTLSVAVSGAVHIASDKVSITGSITGDALDFVGGADSISKIHVVADESTIEAAGLASLRLKDDGVTGAKLAPAVAGYGLAQDGSGNLDVDLSELTAEVIASGDFLAFQDVTDDGTHKETVDDLAALFAGAGLGASAAVISVANATNGGLAVNANDVQLDLNDLSAADVAVAADSIAIIDANDSNATKKESIADLVAAMAGAGLAASNGVLSTQAGTSTQMSSGTALSEGYNFTTGSAGGSFTLPNNPSTGDIVVIKRGQTGDVTVSTAHNSQTIDGETAILLESPHAAVSLVYLVTGSWGIV
tara:strand:- start:1598 stop:3604 length:2007 start_codon:yes stop_codon:yes gene_type:complete